jgi:hypothetical protein
MTLVNSGTINANQPNTLWIAANGGTTNTGLLEATNKGTLGFSNTIVTNTGARIDTSAGSITTSGTPVVINGGTLALAGGSLTNTTVNGATATVGSGNLQWNNAMLTGGTLTNKAQIETTGSFSNTVGGTVTNAATGLIQIDDNAGLNLQAGTYTNAGTITLNSGPYHLSQLIIDAPKITLGGGGTVVMNNSANNQITARTAGATLTNQETIEGAGNIGAGQIGLVNSGVINANQPTPLIISTSASGFNNQGTLSVATNDTLQITTGTPFQNVTGTTLKGGSYNVSGTLQFGASGTSLVTNAANITLSGFNSRIIDAAGNDVLKEFATNASGASFTVNNTRNFTTAGNFTNNGTLAVGGGSNFSVNGNLTNFSGTTLTGGIYNVSGTFKFNGANIVTNAANITLNGTSSQILNQSSGNGLANLASNATAGAFTLQGGHSFTTAGSFSNAGVLSIGTGSTFTVGGAGSFTQTSGTTTDNGTLALPAAGKLNLNGGSLFGLGTITGAIASSGSVTPGNSITSTGILKDSGVYTQNSSGSLNIAIAGTTAGTQYDQLNPTTAKLNGTLNLSLSKGYVPTVGSTFKIMNFTSETGTFTKVTGLAINSAENFKITYQPTDVLLTVVSNPASVTALRNPAAGFNQSLQGYGRPTLASVPRPRVQLPNTIAEVIPRALYKGPVFAKVPAGTGAAIHGFGSMPAASRSAGQSHGVAPNRLLSYNVNVLSVFGKGRVSAFRNSLTQVGDPGSPSLFSVAFTGSH